MNILLTDYIYPITSPLIISKYYKFELDNPRENDEIELIKVKIKEHHQKSDDLRFPPRADKRYISLASMLRDIAKYYSKDDYFNEIFNKNFNAKSYDKIYSFLAKIWIIARYNDQGENERLNKIQKKMKKKGKKGFFILDDENPIEKNASKLVDFSHLISLLVNTDDEFYNGRCFIYDRLDLLGYDNPRFIQCLLYLCVGCHLKNKKDNTDWLIFPKIKDKLIEVSSNIDYFLTNNTDDKLSYISNLLRIASKGVSDNKLKIVLLTSLIEFILTRNPNSNRFNVEDSISKQFQLKTSIIIYQNNKSQNIDEIKNNLKIIYKTRSCIAHGNIDDLNAILKKEKKQGNEYFLDNLVHILYQYLKAIINEYLKDPKFIEYLKMS